MVGCGACVLRVEGVAGVAGVAFAWVRFDLAMLVIWVDVLEVLLVFGFQILQGNSEVDI